MGGRIRIVAALAPSYSKARTLKSHRKRSIGMKHVKRISKVTAPRLAAPVMKAKPALPLKKGPEQESPMS